MTTEQIKRQWHNVRRRFRYAARHSEGVLHPAVKIALFVAIFAVAAALAVYTLTIR